MWNIFHSKKNWARYDKNVYWSSRILHPCPILMNLHLDRFFGICTNIQFHKKKTVQREPSCSPRTDGQAAWRTDMTKLIIASKNQKDQNTSQKNTLHFSEESELIWKFFYNNDISVSTTQEINGFSFTNAHRLKNFGEYFHSMGRIILRSL